LVEYVSAVAARRRKHQKKEVEAVLREAEGHGFTVETPPKGYFKVKCPPPCAEHMWQVHLTPSGRNYAKNLQSRLRKCSTWKEGA
jgi:hypothetical protein